MTTTPTIVPLTIDADLLALIEATDAEVGDRHESIDIGPIAGNYVRVCAPDLIVVVDAVRKLLDDLETVVFDARHDKMMAERHRCYCGASLEPDEISCGSSRCDGLYAEDHTL